MGFHTIAGAAFRALTARKDGPSLYDVCDPVLLKYRGGDPHLGKFYRTALGNPALRPLLRRTGLPALRDEKRLGALQEALRQARAELRRLILSEADQPSIEAKHAQVQQLMTEGLAKRINTLKEITPLLTPEQREKFAAMMEHGRHLGRHRQQS